ncbi:hypothetical protein U1Q18_050794 [Sarracenia purpurea var. burkii]
MYNIHILYGEIDSTKLLSATVDRVPPTTDTDDHRLQMTCQMTTDYASSSKDDGGGSECERVLIFVEESRTWRFDLRKVKLADADLEICWMCTVGRMTVKNKHYTIVNRRPSSKNAGKFATFPLDRSRNYRIHRAILRKMMDSNKIQYSYIYRFINSEWRRNLGGVNRATQVIFTFLQKAGTRIHHVEINEKKTLGSRPEASFRTGKKALGQESMASETIFYEWNLFNKSERRVRISYYVQNIARTVDGTAFIVVGESIKHM